MEDSDAGPHLSRPETPVASKTVIPAVEQTIAAQDSSLAIQDSSSPSTSAQPNTMLPVPTFSTNNKTQVSFVYPDNIDDSNLFSPLPSEMASADISIASDGSYVETSSGPAARELKRRYDQHHGVGKDVRSPYAITSLINQHGKQIYRVGLRDMSGNDSSAADAELELPPPKSLADSPDQGRSKRRSQIQMSFHDVFKKGSSSRPTTVSPQNHPPRKLRKTRSIPDVRQSNEHVGRGHSQSVTAADMLSITHSFANDTIPYSATVRPRRGDMFAEVMDWASPLSSSSTGFSTPSLPHLSTEASDERYPAVIVHPFGAGIVFDSPSKPTASEHLRTPRLLREMQSFESTRTARQLIEPRSERVSGVPSLGSSESDSFDLRRPPSAIRLRGSITSSAEGAPAGGSTPSPKVIEPIYPLPETAMHSRYSTDIFDILQTYRGLPQFDMLISTEDTTVKMTLDALDSIAPKDDPRFVIWGEPLADRDDVSVSQDSVTDLSSSGHSMSLSKRRSTKSKGKSAPEIPSLQLSSGSRASRLLIAATIERWIAQLTSVLNYDELLVFFLTYRTYISSVDLCHLLICRFHWSLQTTGSVSDDKNRRVVRTRTFVAFRYWLLTFFTVDFLPSRELRLLVASWLNALIRDPILEKHVDGVNTVKKLIKVVKDCKKAHTRAVPQPKPSIRSKSASAVKEEKLFGEKFAEATRKLEADDDSDVDLDFVPDEADVSASNSGTAHLNSIHLTSALSPSGPNSIPASSLSILQQTDHAPGPGPEPPTSPYQTSAVLPMHHGLVVRTFVKTMGRIERFKRGFSKRSTQVRTPLTGCTSVSAFELEPSAELTTGHGIEPSVRVIDPPQPLLSPPLVLSPAPLSAPAAPLSESAPSPVESPLPSGSTETESAATPIPVEPPPGYSDGVAEPTAPPGLDDDEEDEEPEMQNDVTVDVVDLNDDRVSLARSSSTDSFGEPLSNAPTFQSPWGFDVVSIDDLDLSDASSEHDGPSFPPGLRKPTKKLPLRRDFKFAPRPESVSSMGIHTNRDSIVSAASSTASSVSVTLGGQIQQWQVNALVDSLTDDGEAGDREDALRRLEGQINPRKQQEKATKVDGWVRNIQARLAAGDYTDEPSRFPDDDDDDQEEDGNDHSESSSPPEIIVAEADVQTGNELVPNPSTPTPPENTTPSLRSADAKPAPEDAVPLEILQSRMPPEVVASPPRPVISSKFVNAEPMRAHRSFVIGHRAEVLAQHFAMIDRELFMGVKFEELVLDDWMACEEVNILDWAQYLKDRARWKAESRFPEKTSALAAVRARFNLMATFTVSEIVLTAPNDRPVVFAKFLRIAWKSYCLQSFNTLVAIITALRSDWVTNAMRRHWNRLGLWESRILTDFKQWCTAEDNFKYIRQTINALVDAKPLEAGSHAAASVVSGGASASETHRSKGSELKAAVNSACVPFIGVYLAQLHHHSRLPDLIDPTAPNAAVTVDPLTGNFDRPSHPEVFSTLAPLPLTMDLEPLINVHKQRLIAGVIKSLVASQHLASRVQFSVDKKLFQKCLRLRGLDAETLSRAFSLSSDTH